MATTTHHGLHDPNGATSVTARITIPIYESSKIERARKRHNAMCRRVISRNVRRMFWLLVAIVAVSLLGVATGIGN